MVEHITITRREMPHFVPISRFNRGEASKIFAEVNKKGLAIVVKHNIPVCVLIKPEIYDGIVEMLEDYRQFFEANKHLKNTESEELISHEQQLNDLGMGTSDLKDVDKDIE